MIDTIFGPFATLSALLDGRAPAAIAAMGVLGLVVGSFLMVIVVRLPVMLTRREREDLTASPAGSGGPEAEAVTLIAPRSHCPRCGHRLRWFENIPVVSYLFLRAKCANCGKAISPLYPAVELLACFVAIVAAIRFGGDVRLYGALVLSFALIPIAMIDARHVIIPDDIVLPMLWLGLLCNAFDLFTPLRDALFGAVAGYGTLWSVYWLHRLATGKEGMGYGDFKLAAMLGAWLGVGLVPLVLVLAFAAGAVVGTGLMIARRTGIAMAIPFGPFLAAAGWVALYWGDAIVNVYWGLVLRW